MFSDYPNFTRRFKEARIEWFCPFPEKNLSIVVRTPIMATTEGPYDIAVRRPITFSVCRNIEGTGRTLRLYPTLMSSAGWMNVTREKINVLCNLIDEISSCPKCGAYFYPHYNKEIQANPDGTPHVMLACPTPKCGKDDKTKFRSANRLKSRLHRWIIPGV